MNDAPARNRMTNSEFIAARRLLPWSADASRAPTVTTPPRAPPSVEALDAARDLGAYDAWHTSSGKRRARPQYFWNRNPIPATEPELRAAWRAGWRREVRKVEDRDANRYWIGVHVGEAVELLRVAADTLGGLDIVNRMFPPS